MIILYANFFLLPFLANPVTAIAVTVGVAAYTAITINQLLNNNSSGTFKDLEKMDKEANRLKFVDGGKYGSPATEGEKDTIPEIKEDTDNAGGNAGTIGAGVVNSPSYETGQKFGNLANTSGSSLWATDIDGYYEPNIVTPILFNPFPDPRLNPNRNPDPEPDPNDNPNQIDPDLDRTDPKKINDFNQRETGLPKPNPAKDRLISIDFPIPVRNIGETLTQPIIPVSLTIFTAPTKGDKTTSFDSSEMMNAVQTDNKLDEYISNLSITYLGQNTETEKTLKLANQSILFLPTALISGLSVQPIVGLNALYRFAEAFRSYSAAATSTPPILRIPSQVKIEKIDGVEEGTDSAPFNDIINDLIKPFPIQYQEKLADNMLIPANTNIDIESLMTFLGNTEIYQGGSEELNKFKQDYKNNPNAFYNSEFLTNTPSINDIINDEVDPNKLKPKETPNFTKVTTQFDILQKMIATNYVRSGLDQFPAQLPSLKDPIYREDSEGKRNIIQEQSELVIPSFAGGLGYSIASLHKSIGRFPLEIETETSEGKKDTAYFPDLGNGLTQALTLGMMGVAMSQSNFDLNLRNSKQIQETKRIASKGASCSCSALAATGMNTNPSANCSQEQMNFKDAKGLKDFFTQQQVCHSEMNNVDGVTLKEMLQDILFGVNIIKGAFFKGANELDSEIEKVQEIRRNIDKEQDRLDDFIDDFNQGRSELSKGFPSKSKIIRKNSTQESS